MNNENDELNEVAVLEQPKDRNFHVGKRVFNCVFAAILLATVGYVAFSLASYSEGLVTAMGTILGLFVMFPPLAMPLIAETGVFVIAIELEIYHDLKYFLFDRHKRTRGKTFLNIFCGIMALAVVLPGSIAVQYLGNPMAILISNDFIGFLFSLGFFIVLPLWVLLRIIGGIACVTNRIVKKYKLGTAL